MKPSFYLGPRLSARTLSLRIFLFYCRRVLSLRKTSLSVVAYLVIWQGLPGYTPSVLPVRGFIRYSVVFYTCCTNGGDKNQPQNRRYVFFFSFSFFFFFFYLPVSFFSFFSSVLIDGILGDQSARPPGNPPRSPGIAALPVLGGGGTAMASSSSPFWTLLLASVAASKA